MRKLGSSLAILLTLLIAGCPKPPQFQPDRLTMRTGSVDFSSPVPSATPTAGAPYTVTDVSGTLYSDETGQPIPLAIVLLDGVTRTITGLDGSFTATRSSAVTAPSVTVLRSGYANLTVHGYQGGILTMVPRLRPAPAATTSVKIWVVAPPAIASAAAIGISVKRSGYAYSLTQITRLVSLSQAGTGSLTVSLPAGEATIVGAGWQAPLAGLFQGAVAPELTVTLSATESQATYETEVPVLRTDGSVSSISAYYLNWPGDTPSHPNSVMIAAAGGGTGDEPISLPPVDSFGLPGAYYTVYGFADSNTSAVVNATAIQRHITPGRRILPLLAEPVTPMYYPGDETKNQTFEVPISAAVNGANAYMLDVASVPTTGPVERLWRLVSLGTSTGSLELPILPATMRASYGLTVGTHYAVSVSAAAHPMSPDGDQAFTSGPILVATYNRLSATSWRLQPFGRSRQPLVPGW